MASTQNIILIGFMGSGKTTVGKQLAKDIKFRFSDTDTLIEKEEHRSISQIFKQEGEDYFRQVECKLCETLIDFEHSVIATGGGFPIPKTNQDHLKLAGIIVFLNTGFETISKRIKTNAKRPLAKDTAVLKSLYNERQPLYRALSDYEIQTEQLSVKDISAKISHLLSTHTL